MPSEAPSVFSELDDLIAGIVRGKLRVSLRADDGRQENQDALEIVSKAHVEVLRKLQGDSSDVRNLRDYASTVTYHACAEYLRGKYAGRFRLQYKLRYFLSHHRDFGIWTDDAGVLTCGLAKWKSGYKKGTPSGALAAVAHTSADNMKAADWEKLCRAIFEDLRGPVAFQSFVAVAASVLGVESFPEEELADYSAPGPSPENTAAALEILRALWAEILLIDLRWRRAFLLNPPRDVELEVFPENGIASIDEIGVAVGVEDAEYAIVWSEVNAGEAQRCFAMLWKWLPLRDALIARLLQAEVQQVINLRRLARDRLAARLAPRLGKGGVR